MIDGANEDGIKRHLVENGFMTLRKAGIRKIQEGVTSIEEVRAATLGDSE